MQFIKRDLSIGLAASTLVFACALAFGSPFVGAGSGSKASPAQDQTQPQPQPDQGQAQPQKSDSKTFTGTVLKSGSQYVLRDSSGQVFKLDDAESAKPYEGKAVKVTGQLVEQAMLIHMQSIEGSEA